MLSTTPASRATTRVLLSPSDPPHHASTCGAVRRHARRRRHVGTLRSTSPDVAARLCAEGVPAADISVVAPEVERCIRVLRRSGDDVLSLRLHPWTMELLARYGDKLCCLLMTTRGKVDAW